MKLGVIGGSGLYDLDGLKEVREERVETPFGDPSDVFVCGRLGSCELVFLPRHGRGHRLLPAEINHRANIYAFKVMGVSRVVSISAVGSLKEKHRPRDIVLPDQYFDRTKQSMNHTFFGRGLVAHVSFAEPGCPHLRHLITGVAESVVEARKLDVRVSVGGTYVNMEGPAFSTKAESFYYRGFGFDVIGMTSLGEAKLCREAEICYQGITMVTDYDCWREAEEAVSVEMLIGHLHANTELGKEIVRRLALMLPEESKCECGSALASAIMTRKEAASPATLAMLKPIVGKYM